MDVRNDVFRALMFDPSDISESKVAIMRLESVQYHSFWGECGACEKWNEELF